MATVAGRARSRIPGTSSVPAALGAAFAVVFVLWLFWGYQLVQSLRDIEHDVDTVQASYVEGEQTLLRIRTNVLLGSIYLRDALIDGALPQRSYYQGELERLRTESEGRLLAHLPSVTSDQEREQWERLRVELGEYWASRSIPFSPGTKSPLESAALLRTRIVPRRNSVLAILDQLGELQTEANHRRQRELDLVYKAVGGRLLLIGALSLMLAVVVGVVASWHVQRLHRQIERQRHSERENRRDLERLSARLVDAQEHERRNLARELHDAVGQALTAVKMDIGIALRAEGGPRVRAALEEARDITETTLRGVRDLSQLLHPSMLDDFGLPATLTAHLRRFSQRTGIDVQLVETLEARLPPAVEVCVYRLVQEALNNVALHSGATVCTVWLHAAEDVLRLRIEDNGHGLSAPSEPAAITARGLGIIGMRERAQTLGGTFGIESDVGEGTRVIVTLPLQVGGVHRRSDGVDAAESHRRAG